MADTHIKIKPVTPRVQYTANGSTTVFPYSFAIFDETDMVVYVDDTIITTGYTVSGAGQTDGGNVTFDSAPVDGTIITLLRNVPIERMTDFQEGGTFRPKNINDEFDRQTAFAQQVQEALSRCVKVDPTSESNPEEILPKIEELYDHVDNIDAVAADLTNIDTVATNASDVGTCATNMEDIMTVEDNISNINIVAGMSSNISSLASDLTNINNVASDLTNIDAVASELPSITTKANTNASNFTVTGKSYLSGIGMPSDYYEEVTAGASMTEYTAPANGYFTVDCTATGTNCLVKLISTDDNDATEKIVACTRMTAATQKQGCSIPVKKSQKVIMFYSNVTINKFIFVYAEGEPNV